MAVMLPSFVPRDAAPGEQEVFLRLRDDPAARDWRVLHSLDIAKHDTQISGEADFVVVVPNRGVAVLEVKSHTRIRFTPQGWYLGNAVAPEKRGPFRQAADAMHSLRNYVIERRPELAKVPFCSAVVLPSVPFAVESPEWRSWQVIDRQAFHAKPFSALVIRLLREAVNHFRLNGLSLEPPDERQATEICRVLRPFFDVIASPRALREQVETEVLRCTEEQFDALDSVADNERVLFEGPAGSGKTSLAVEVWRRWKLTQPNQKGALFCFNRLLSNRLRYLTDTLATDKTVGSFSAFLLDSAEVSPRANEVEDPAFWNDRLPTLVVDSLITRGDSEVLDSLILDEAQDLMRPQFLDVFDLLLKGGLAAGRWMFFGDFLKQNLYAPDALSPSQLIEQRSPKAARFHLSINCRNTPRVASFVELLGNMNPGYGRVLRGDDQIVPVFSYYRTDGEQDAAVQNFLNLMLNEGFQRKDIVLLSPLKNSSASRLAQTSRWKSVLAPYREEDSEHIRFTTIHSFKGMESFVILLTDLNRLASDDDADLFYTGISRSLARLAIFASIDIEHAILQNIQRRTEVGKDSLNNG
jgi:hypothetical protein